MNRLRKLNAKLSRYPVTSDAYVYLKQRYKLARMEHKKLERWFNVQDGIRRDTDLYLFCSGNPSELNKSIKRARSNQSRTIQRLYVGDTVYTYNKVPDGFYSSLSKLKSFDKQSVSTSTTYNGYDGDYKNIIDICKRGDKIPPITEKHANNILNRIRGGGKRLLWYNSCPLY